MTVRLRAPQRRMVASQPAELLACVWCRRSMMHGWWAGMRDWSAATCMVEPCDHPDTLADRPARSRVSDATRVARCQGPNGAAQKAMA